MDTFKSEINNLKWVVITLGSVMIILLSIIAVNDSMI